ncbi:MAG: DUF3089 domain-containing protein [Pacificimonas sp.]
MAANRFLLIITVLIIVAVIGVIGYIAFGQQLLQRFMVPSVSFAESPEPAPTFYDSPEAWIARPGLPSADALWTPEGFPPSPSEAASVFYVHPTTYLRSDRWNAPIEPDDEGALYRRGLFTRSQASVFNSVGDIWAPKYRQAAFGAFLAFAEPDAAKAFALAYTDVENAFDAFLAGVPEDRPIILAGHSQGSLHLVTLLARRIAGTPLQERIVAAYLPGWPISIEADLSELGLVPCEEPAQTGCILTFQSFSEPADPGLIFDAFDATNGLAGEPRADTQLVCTNPLTGGAEARGGMASNLGTLVPDDSLAEAELEIGLVGAECTGRGYLSLGENALSMGQYVLPGNNYHVYDYALFWANLRADAERRVAAFPAR